MTLWIYEIITCNLHMGIYHDTENVDSQIYRCWLISIDDTIKFPKDFQKSLVYFLILQHVVWEYENVGYFTKNKYEISSFFIYVSQVVPWLNIMYANYIVSQYLLLFEIWGIQISLTTLNENLLNFFILEFVKLYSRTYCTINIFGSHMRLIFSSLSSLSVQLFWKFDFRS